GEEQTYRLEEVELSGEIRDLGIHEVRFDEPAAPTAVSRSALAAKPAAKAVRPKNLAGPSAVLKVQVDREGLYGVSWQAIADGMGLAPADVRALAEAGSLKIARQGEAVPALVDAARERLVFHARSPVRSWYAHADAYLVSVGEGAAMPRRAPGAASGATVFPTTIRFEQNDYLFNMNRMPDDFYFWIPVMSGFGELSVTNVPLDLGGYAGGDVALTVRLMGWSSSTNYPDHLARFAFNGVELGTISFDGQDVAEARLVVPAAAVASGANALTIEGILQPGRAESFFVVDWIEATFARELDPGIPSAMFGPNGAGAVSAQAFAEPLAVAVDAAGRPTWIADENGALPAKAWAVADPAERFAVVEAAAVPLLAPEPAAANAWFLAADNQIDYLVIASRELAPSAQELVDYRAGQGLRAGLATFEDACDLLAGGVRTPAAIQALLKYAAATWAVAPRMVVLAGSGHYDYLGINTVEANHLPPLLVQMPAGVCAADGLLADTGGDEQPDLAIGRLPALTAAELAAMIAKIKAYEAGFGAEWQNQIVLAADNADAAGQFPAANQRLADLVAAPYAVAQRIELGAMAFTAARTNLLRWFNVGAGFINYVGHGDIKNLAAEKWLKDTDVAAMVNVSRPPVVATLTCLAARYEVPAVHSLGERLLRRAGGGAVAVLGPSGLSQNAPAAELAEAFYRAILREGAGELGPAFLKARRSLPESLFTKDTIAVYNLLGDPALKIAGNDPADEPVAPAQVILAGLAQTYDGTPRAAMAATVPAGLAVRISYDGQLQAPTAAGTYAVVASVATVGYEGFATGTLVVAKAPAAVVLSGLAQTYDGTPRAAAVATVPAGL
ncbi:MAG TPA: C25 family cysteine peptidase, partial [Kiritimatiellia bacterium]|nr:C25 family cysteine peptidase [Kiritimatiellia bacterium]